MNQEIAVNHAYSRLDLLLQESEFSYFVEPINDNFTQTILRAEGKKWGNPEFDCTLHEFSERNSFWIGCKDRNGDVVSTVAARHLKVDSVIEESRTYRLWYGSKIRFTEPLDIILQDSDRVPSGSIVFAGCSWVRPDHRGNGLSWALARMAYYRAMRMWQPQWIFAIALTGIFKSAVATVDFGFTNVEYFARDFRIPGLGLQDVYLMNMTGQDAVALARSDIEFANSRPQLRLDRSFGDELKTDRRKVG